MLLLILHVVLPILFNKRQELPHIVRDYPLEHIHNFDESGLMYRMLATSGNIIGAAKERRGAKLTKDRNTIGICSMPLDPTFRSLEQQRSLVVLATIRHRRRPAPFTIIRIRPGCVVKSG